MQNGKPKFSLPGYVIILLIIFLLSACTSDSTISNTGVSSPTPSIEPTLTATPEPLGSPGNPLVLGVMLEDELGDKNAYQQLVDQLSLLTDMNFKYQLFTTWDDLDVAIKSHSVQISFLPPLTYLHARDLNLVRVGLLTNHYGVYYYGTQILANIESGFIAYFDPVSNQTTGDAATALAQFQDRRPCWIEPSSLAGYYYPSGLLLENNVIVKEPAFIQSNTGAIRALYIKGICDFAATFAISGDPRTSSSVMDDLPDIMNRVVVIWRSDPVIPNLNVSYDISLTNDMVSTISTAFTDMVDTQEGQLILSSALNYDIQDLRVVDDSIYNALRRTLQFTDINFSTTLGR